MELGEQLTNSALQRVPPTGATVTPFEVEGSLDSTYEDNFDCGEEALQRRLLINRILSSPLLFSCASAPLAEVKEDKYMEDMDNIPETPDPSEGSDTEDGGRLDISRTDTEIYECSPVKQIEVSDSEIGGKVDECNLQGLRSEVARVLQEIINRVALECECLSEDVDDCSDAIPVQTLLSWQRSRRPMSGRSVSTDSGISLNSCSNSADECRLSAVSTQASDYAGSPDTAHTCSSDESRAASVERQTRSRRRYLPPIAEPQRHFEPPLKVQNTANFPCATVSTARGSSTLQVRAASCSGSSISSCSSKTAAVAVEKPCEVMCRWQHCGFLAKKDNDLADHISDVHVRTQGESGSYVCLWQECKVFNVPSTLKHWLEQHVVKHSRSKPLKCIVDGCPQRFSTKSLLEAHVNSHFEKSGSKLKNGETPLKNLQLLKLAKRRKLLKNSKMQVGRKYDFFDACIMHQIKERLLQCSEDTSSGHDRKTQVALTDDCSAPGACHPELESMVRAVRTAPTGKRHMLISYYPSGPTQCSPQFNL